MRDNMSAIRSAMLRAGGGLLVALGILHIAVTPHVAHLIQSSTTREAAAWLMPPMLLNHVVLGGIRIPWTSVDRTTWRERQTTLVGASIL